MDQCPSEVWAYIFELACTDGGVTGCSITLVSRYFREIVLPVQLYSVALRGATKMVAFAKLLEQRSPAHRRVRHLFLANNGHSIPENSVLHIRDLNDILFWILTTLAPDLLTLASTLHENAVTKSSVLSISFPCLTELTLNGYLLYPDVRIAAPMRYLHILSACNSAPLYTARAPGLTHLRLSTLSTIHQDFQQALEDFLTGSGAADQQSIRHPFPSTIQKIVIQQDRVITRSLHGGMGGWTNRVIEGLQALLHADKGRKLEILAKNWTKPPDRSARDCWEDRIVGGCGCWGETDVLGKDIGSKVAPI